MSLYEDNHTASLNATFSSFGNESGIGYGENDYGYGYGDGCYDSSKKAEEQYYGALSVAVLTLGLILCVEEFRHRIDHSAIGRPFFLSVLDGVYRELATLGVVELAVHLLQTYSDGLDKNKKAVFADVHFLLFYTAIFNAFQAAILAFSCNFVTDKLWIKTEELELDHYIEVREEFDRLHEEIYGVAPEHSTRTQKNSKSFADSLRNLTVSRGYSTEERTLKTLCISLYYTIIYPQLKARYNQLRVQIRFHEIRVHFLQSYKLPTKMKLSDYLVKSLFHVLQHFVHVSHSTWLLLTAVCNVLYFLMGIIADITGEGESTGLSLSIIFFAVMVIFIIISVIIYYHMESIFKKLVKMNHLWNIWDEDTEENEKKSQELMEQQQALFLFGDPELVINVIQFMQFGYAIALSVVFVYWDDMQKDDDFDASAYLVATLLCYSVFLIVMARVMPLYTVCTSLGQLVDKQRLHEVRAAFHLEEAERLRHEQHFPGATNSKRSSSGLTKKTESYNSLHSLDPTAKEQSSDESTMSVPMVVPKLLENASVSQDSSTRQSSDSKTSVDEVKLLANLVKMDTKSLRQIVPPPEKPENSTRGSRVSREHQRSFSDGIQSMRNLGNLSFSSMEDNSNKELHKAESSKKVTFDDAAVAQAKTLDHRQRRERRRSQSASATIQAMRDVNYDGPLNSSLGNIAEDAPNEDDPKVADDVQALPSKKAPATTGTPVVANVLDVVPEQELMNDFSFNEEDDDSMSQLSDVEQNTLTIWEKKTNHEQVEHETVSHSLKQRICNFFDGPSYIFVTNILGTMICFFLIGMRVEGFVKKQCIIPWDDYSWDLTLDFSFRLLVAWFSSFIGVSLILVFLSQNLRKRYMFFAGVIDIILSTICLVLLLEAEKQRCCNDGIDVEESLLEEDLYDFRLLKESDACYDVTLECSCAEFGHRMSGGLGSMEPFTALIALRVFRFGLAKRLTNFFRSKDDDSHGHHSYNHGHGHDHGHGEELGSAVELWQHAIAKAPDIVEKYGEFSSELLQVMLGIEVIESTPVSTAPKELKDRSAEESSTESAVGVPVSSEPERGHVVLEEKKYKKLKPEVQEIIAAGRMGLPVKPCLAASSKSEIQRPSSRAVAPMAPLEFKVDKKSAQLEHEHANSTLSFPNATLVRSMRRCERKLLPLLNKWTTVDVVITNHEMVYVDVHDAGDSELREDELAKCKASKEAVKATHGGKGLRLCDVTAGRRIVGHLSFNDVISVHVEREPAATSASTDDEENDVDIVVREHNEFWQPNTNTESSFESKQKRWDKVNQDRLRLHTAHGTMYLRFHSDLVDSELHPERVIEEVGDESPLHKDIAFQWAQTIVWNCGAGQLHQALPHFGDDNGDELRDYLQIVPKVKQHGHNRRLASFTPHFDRVQSFSIRRKGSRGQHHRSPSPVKRRGRSPPPASRLQSKSPPPPSRREDTAEEEKKEPKENIVVEC